MYIVKEDPGGHTHNIIIIQEDSGEHVRKLWMRTLGDMYVYCKRGPWGTYT